MTRVLLVAAVIFGAGCRLLQYAAATSLWHDESFVALNVLHIPFADLLGPLEWNEPSPPGFLAVEKLMVAALGQSELVLRSVPFLASVAALIAFAGLALHVCRSERGALWAVVLCAASAKLIEHANLVKHFSLDLLLTVVLVGVAWRAARDATPPALRLLAWGAIGAVGLWFSYATAFVIAGTSAVLAVSAARRWPAAARTAYVLANLAVLASAAALFGAVHSQRSGVVVQYWGDAFPDNGDALRLAAWLARSLIGIFDYTWRPLGGLLLIPSALAVAAYARTEQRTLLLLLWGPVALALLAALFRWWPFGGNQHMVFAAPAVLVAAGDGIEIARQRLAGRHPLAAAAALTLLLAPGVADALYHLAVPRQRHDVRGAIAFMQQRVAPGDELAVFDPATFQFYTGRDLRGASLSFAAPARVWLITPCSRRGELHADVQRLVDRLLRERSRLAVADLPGATAQLFGPASPQ